MLTKTVGRERRPCLAAALLASVLAGAPAFAGDPTIVAIIDQSKLVKVPPGTQTLVIGNATIADVTLLKKNNLMILTPKAFGQTNYIAIDGDGKPVAESMIEVVAGAGAVVVQRGMDRQSYSCAPTCQPTERLGDDDKYSSTVATQAQAHFARLAGSAAPMAPGR